MRRLLLVLPLASLCLACPPRDDTATPEGDTDTDADADSDTDTDADSDTDTDADSDTDTDTDSDTDTDPGAYPQIPAEVVTGDITWTLDFDSEAEAGGYADCAYSRSYEGVQYLDQPWLCPACTHQFVGTAVMSAGFEDCYEPVFGGDADRTEYWGLTWPTAQGGQATFFRGATENYALGELTTATDVHRDTPFDLAWDATYTFEDLQLDGTGSVTLAATGTVTLSTSSEVRIDDLRQPRATDYACGWPRNNPGDLSSDWTLALAATLPTAWLEDSCGEKLDLWDLYGSYLVIDATQADCGFCLQMAQEAPEFLNEMEDLGIPVLFVSALGGGLSDVIGEPSDSTFQSYLAAYGTGDPLLKDRGYGYALFGGYLGEDLGYPAWAVVAPDMQVLSVQTGFSSWDEMGSVIMDDWEG
jgi:hypothetical protein